MINQELIKYLKEGEKRGFSIDELGKNLIDRGWNSEDVSAAISNFRGVAMTPETSPVTFVKPGKEPIHKNTFLFGGAFLFVIILIVGAVFLFGGESVETVTTGDIESGAIIEMKTSQIKLNYDDKKSESVEMLRSNIDFAEMKINGDRIKFNKDEKINLDLDGDGIMDVEMTYQGMRNDLPSFFIEKYERDIERIIREEVIVENASEVVNNSIVNESLNESIEINISFNESAIAVNESLNESMPLNESSCILDWSCSLWSLCSDNKRTRSCQNWNFSCEPKVDKEIEEMSCSTVGEESPEEYCEFNNMTLQVEGEACGPEVISYNGIVCCEKREVIKISELLVLEWNLIENSGNCTAQLISDSLNSCSPYKCTFDHFIYEMFTGEKAFIEKGIIGASNGSCNYYEEVVMGGPEELGIMYCQYNESERVDVASYYLGIGDITIEDLMSEGFNWSSSDEDALSDAMDRGDCETYDENGNLF